MKIGTLVFYGAEPTINFSLIEHAVEYVKTKDVEFELAIVTNGTMLTNERINFMKDNNITIGISIDGPKESNDVNRVFKDSNNSVYDAVRNAITRINEIGAHVGLSITLSNEVLNDKNFVEWIKTLEVSDINYNLMHFSKRNSQWKKYYKKASEFLINSDEELSKNNIFDDRFARKRRAFYGKEFKYSDCGAVGAGQLAIKPNGDVTICHGLWNNQKDICGNINSNTFNEIITNKIFDKWQNNLTINKKTCLKCPAIFICGGGCPMHCEILFKKQDKVDKPFCIHTKKSFNYLLEELYHS